MSINHTDEISETLLALRLPTVFERPGALAAWERLMDTRTASGTEARTQAEEDWARIQDLHDFDVYLRGSGTAEPNPALNQSPQSLASNAPVPVTEPVTTGQANAATLTRMFTAADSIIGCAATRAGITENDSVPTDVQGLVSVAAAMGLDPFTGDRSEPEQQDKWGAIYLNVLGVRSIMYGPRTNPDILAPTLYKCLCQHVLGTSRAMARLLEESGDDEAHKAAFFGTLGLMGAKLSGAEGEYETQTAAEQWGA